MKKAFGSFFAFLLVLVSTIGLASCNKVEFKVDFVVDGEVYASLNTNGRETVKMPDNPVKEGYTFDGWYWDKDEWNKPFTANSLLDAPLSSDMKVYAKWRDNQQGDQTVYTVTFETNGGTSVDAISAAVIETSPVTNKDYNTFVGWYSDASLGESTKVSFPYTPTKDITLYAKWSVDFTDGLQLALQVSTNTYAVTGYTGTAAVVEIPSQYKGLDVTAINARAFEGNTMITSVLIPDSVITVGLGAFSECYNLESIKMSSQLQLLGASAFSNCIKLQRLDLPDALMNIGGEAFFGCSSLKELYLSNELTNIGANIIRGCNSLEKLTMPGRITLVSLVGDTTENIPASLTELVVADGSESVCEKMLYNCENFKTIKIADSVTSIGYSAFEGCTSLTSVHITDIAAWYNIQFSDSSSNPLYYAKNLYLNGKLVTALVIPDGVKSIGDSAFYGCSGLTSVNITDIAAWCNIQFDSSSSNPLCYAKKLYLNGELVTELIIPDGVTSIGYCAFYGCSGLTSITIPDSVKSISYSAFMGCARLENITLPFVGEKKDGTGDTHFGYIFGAYSYSDNSSYVPNSLKTVIITGDTIIGVCAFYGCSGLTSITIPNSVTSIGGSAFGGCSGLTSITIPDSVTSIGYSAFEGCTSLESITLPFVGEKKDGTGDTHFGYIFGAYSYSDNSSYVPNSLKTVIITGGTSIGDYAFYDCSGLASITIPDSVKSIGDPAFLGCSGLTSVHITDMAAWCNIQFDSSSSNPLCYAKNLYLNGKLVTELIIPDGVTSISDYAFRNCSKLTSITIPDSVKRIGSSAFRDCSGLTSVNITDIAAWCSIQFGDNPLYYAKNLYLNGELVTELVIPSGVTSIGSYAFKGCTSITSVNLPITVTSIGRSAFMGCTSLTSVTIGNGVTSIGSYAFDGCSALTSITIPDSVTSIGASAFEGCTMLESITLPFVGATKDGTGGTHFGYIFGAPSYSSNSSYVPNSLKTVIITGGTSIGYFAFKGCSALTSITIPDSVTIIGASAFYGCSGLANIKYRGTEEQWNAISKEFAWDDSSGNYTVTYNYKGD